MRRGLISRLGSFDLPSSELAKLWIAAIIAAILSTVVRLSVPVSTTPVPMLLYTVPLNAVAYLGITMWWDVPEAAVLTGRIGQVARRMRTGR